LYVDGVCEDVCSDRAEEYVTCNRAGVKFSLIGEREFVEFDAYFGRVYSSTAYEHAAENGNNDDGNYSHDAFGFDKICHNDKN
jgi:hypothetical protein